MRGDGLSSGAFKLIGRKALIYGISLFLLAVFQGTALASWSPFGAIPDLMLSATLTLAMLEGEQVGGVAGIGAGFLSFAFGSSAIYILFSFICGYTLGLISERALGKNLPSFFALALLTHFAKALFNLVDASLFSSRLDVISAITRVILPEILASLLLCAPVYLLFRALCRLVGAQNSKRKERKLK